MSHFNPAKYRPFPAVPIENRQWPDRIIKQAPDWCSVDLRDGNQALMEPMSVAQKMALFELLVKVGFKEIEVGFPAASQQDFDFVRFLIEENKIPDDVTIQVLTQAREALIARSFEALKGARRVIVHVYNSTSTVQREQVFQLDRAGIKAIAVEGASWVKQQAALQPQTDWVFQYSPESFTGTELDFAVDVCNAVLNEWQPTVERPAIINLPATVEMATPNIYADQIEWFCRHINQRNAVRISLHTHNDRGCAVAAAELGVMAGADRVEGTLLGNGERTGNMDIVTMAMNLYSQGVDPQLDLSDMDEIIRCVKACTQLPVHPRHPYAGELVYTAFSGSHQDAIKKCLSVYDETDPEQPWQVAYLPIDPKDLGRSYQQVIRINSQSGKGGVAYIMEAEYGLQLPRWLQIDFSQQVQQRAESSEQEVTAQNLHSLFTSQYLQHIAPLSLQSYQLNSDGMQADLLCKGTAISIAAQGGGALEVFVKALSSEFGYPLEVMDYAEHALGHGVEEQAVCYLRIKVGSKQLTGVAIDRDLMAASLQAVLAVLNQLENEKQVNVA